MGEVNQVTEFMLWWVGRRKRGLFPSIKKGGIPIIGSKRECKVTNKNEKIQHLCTAVIYNKL